MWPMWATVKNEMSVSVLEGGECGLYGLCPFSLGVKHLL